MPEPRPDDDAGAEDGPVRARRRRRHRSWARRKHLGLITTGAALLVLVIGLLLVVLTWDNGRPSFHQQVAAAVSSGGGSAAPTSPAPTSGAPSGAPSSGTAGPTDAAGPTTVRGVIAAVGDNQWTLTGSSGLTYTILVTDDTTFMKKRGFSSFGLGDTILVKGTLDQGTVTAKSVVTAKAG